MREKAGVHRGSGWFCYSYILGAVALPGVCSFISRCSGIVLDASSVASVSTFLVFLEHGVLRLSFLMLLFVSVVTLWTALAFIHGSLTLTIGAVRCRFCVYIDVQGTTDRKKEKQTEKDPVHHKHTSFMQPRISNTTQHHTTSPLWMLRWPGW